jgi:putative PIN family toxin of toxin-antitoxin system
MARDASVHRIVIDTNLIISGLIVPHGLPHRLIAAWREGAFHLVVTDAILAEYAAVLARPRFAVEYGLTPTVVAAVMRRMQAEGVRVTPAALLPIAVRDPNDTHLLAAAIGGDADYLITGDDDLLVLDGAAALGRLRIVTVREYADLRPAGLARSDA